MQVPNVVFQSFVQPEQFTIRIQWQRRERKNSAFLKFESPEDCENAMKCFGPNIVVRGYRIYVNPDKQNNCRIFLSGTKKCLCSMDENVLRDSIVLCLGGEITFDLAMNYSSVCEESDESHQFQKTTLENILANCSNPEAFQLSFPKPNPRAVFYQAFVNFSNPNNGTRVLSLLHGRGMIGGKPLIVSPHVSCVLKFKNELYEVVKESLTERKKQLEHQHPKGLRITIKDSTPQSPFVGICITSDDINALSAAKHVLNATVTPYAIDCSSDELREYIVSHAYHDQVDAIQASTSTRIQRDLKMMCINVHGTKDNQLKADNKIREGANELFSGGAKIEKIELGSRNCTPGLMKHLVVTYGKDLSGLHSLEGVRSVGLNPRRQLISVLATSEGLKSIKKCIEEYSPCQGTDQREFEVDCSACLTSIDDPQELIRLEPCGHAYHTECVEMQLQSGTLTFPIQCASENCSESFLLKDFEYLEKQSKFKIKELISASLKCYLQMNTDKHKSCPTPDCEMIYAKTDDGKEFTCSDCGLITCTTCDESHPGITCHMNKAARFGHEEFERWIKANAKKCPKCSVPIEKDGGCNHVICRLCRAHICWVCLNIFETDQHCYAHLRTECAMYP